MRIFSTRHAEALSQRFPCEDMRVGFGDEPITDLGREQAKILAKHLESIGFDGVIFSSPYVRALETASLISEILNIGFTPLKCLRGTISSDIINRFSGLSSEDIKARFPRAEIISDMEYPWWEDKTESTADVIDRLRRELLPIIRDVSKHKDVLLIGHSVTSVALREIFHPVNYKSSLEWNCSLDLLSSDSEESYAHDVSYIPEEMITDNGIRFIEKKAEYENALSLGKSFFENAKGVKLMHIGDTHSALYPYYAKMIEEFKPDVIVHTGDLADELKAGRIEEDIDIWKKTAPNIIEAMRKSGARMILVPGNNDIEEALPSFASDVEVYPRNTVISISEKRICLCHEVWKINESIEADLYLYGHGRTYETRKKNDYIRGSRRYFNAVWGVSLHSLSEERDLILPAIAL